MTDQIVTGRYAGRRSDTRLGKRIRLLNWNIARGQNLAGVMDVIRHEQPDICVLQEVDLNAKRTGRRNLADVLAAQFDFDYAFGIEFEELSQGAQSDPAFQGQAIFARCQIDAPRIVRFGAQTDFWRPRWFLPQWQAFQRRRGGRMALVAQLLVGHIHLVVYDLHLESKGDDNLRLWQLSEVVWDSLQYPANMPVLIAGDLNTRNMPSPLLDYLLTAGFRDSFEGSPSRHTKPSGKTLDWIFVRGPVTCSGIKVHHEVRASDHYPLSATLTLTV